LGGETESLSGGIGANGLATHATKFEKKRKKMDSFLAAARCRRGTAFLRTKVFFLAYILSAALPVTALYEIIKDKFIPVIVGWIVKFLLIKCNIVYRILAAGGASQLCLFSVRINMSYIIW
jgi:hypothetical protein